MAFFLARKRSGPYSYSPGAHTGRTLHMKLTYSFGFFVALVAKYFPLEKASG